MQTQRRAEPKLITNEMLVLHLEMRRAQVRNGLEFNFYTKLWNRVRAQRENYIYFQIEDGKKNLLFEK